MTKHKIILAGGAGLVGQNLLIHFKEKSKELIVLDKHRANLEILRSIHPNIHAEYADLSEKGSWCHHFADAESVIILQAQIGGNESHPFIRNNIISTQNVLEQIQHYKVPYIVHVSSSVVESIANDTYSVTKKGQEELVVQSGIPCAILRPTLMFGWFDRKHLGWLSRFMKKTPIFPIPGYGCYMRQPLYVGDFCNIIMRCIENKIVGTYNISGLERIDYIDLIYRIKQYIDARCWVSKIPYSIFEFLLRTWGCFDRNPPFTAAQLKALTANEEFEMIDWPRIFNVTSTPLLEALEETFTHPIYSKIVLEF